jgi:hypothetical protein
MVTLFGWQSSAKAFLRLSPKLWHSQILCLLPALRYARSAVSPLDASVAQGVCFILRLDRLYLG